MFEWTIVQEKTKIDTESDTSEEDAGDDMEETDYASELEYDGVDNKEEDTESDTPEEDAGDDMEETDYTDMDGDTDTTGEDTETGDTDTTDDTTDTEADTSEGQDNNEARKNADLISDFIKLTEMIKSTNKKISDTNFNSARTNAIIAQVTKNLNLIYKQLFKYITQEFSNNTYIANLFKYNSYIELVKINIAMLKK